MLTNKAKTILLVKEALQAIWDSLPQGPIDNNNNNNNNNNIHICIAPYGRNFRGAVKDFSKRLKACVEAGCGHLENSQ